MLLHLVHGMVLVLLQLLAPIAWDLQTRTHRPDILHAISPSRRFDIYPYLERFALDVEREVWCQIV